MTDRDLTWDQAIASVLNESSEPMHYTEIAEQIAAKKLRKGFGATPANTVATRLSLSLQRLGQDSPYVRLPRGHYTLKSKDSSVLSGSQSEEARREEVGLVSALGMYWRRDRVHWVATPKVLGQQLSDARSVDFSKQRGVYLLHDGREVIYIGRAKDGSLGERLRVHTRDRLSGRWDRFSWFGVCSVNDNGTLGDAPQNGFTLGSLIVTMEALLIEGLEPRQNRQRGEEFRATEYLQFEDPELEAAQLIRSLEAKIRHK